MTSIIRCLGASCVVGMAACGGPPSADRTLLETNPADPGPQAEVTIQEDIDSGVPATGNAALDELMETTARLAGHDPAEHLDAVTDLGRQPSEAALPLLADLVWDPDHDIRDAALDALSEIGDERAAATLGLLLTHEDDTFRQDVVDALTEIGGDGAIELLRQARHDPHSGVRDAAEDGLRELRANLE